jgi:hypothetical protein
MTGAGVMGAFDGFLADLGAFADAGVAAVPAASAAAVPDLVKRLADRCFQAVRGKNPPGW